MIPECIQRKCLTATNWCSRFYRKSCEKQQLASICLSDRPHGKTRFPLERFLRNFIFETYTNICNDFHTLFKFRRKTFNDDYVNFNAWASSYLQCVFFKTVMFSWKVFTNITPTDNKGADVPQVVDWPLFSNPLTCLALCEVAIFISFHFYLYSLILQWYTTVGYRICQ